MKCIFLSDDLIFTQQVSNAIAVSGCEYQTVANLDQARSVINDEPKPNALVVDLNLPGLDFAAVVELASQETARCIGVASHVHQAKIDRAKEAGFDHILTRGQIADRLGPIIKD